MVQHRRFCGRGKDVETEERRLWNGGKHHALDNLCCASGSMVARNGQLLYAGWIHSLIARVCPLRTIDSIDLGPQTYRVTTLQLIDLFSLEAMSWHDPMPKRSRTLKTHGGGELDKDRVKGTIDDSAGRIKRQVGEWTGDRSAQIEGAVQQVKGKTEKVLGKIEDAARESKRKTEERTETTPESKDKDTVNSHRQNCGSPTKRPVIDATLRGVASICFR